MLSQSFMLRFFSPALFVIASVSAETSTCLARPTPAEERTNITIGDFSMPIGIASGDWQFNLILADLVAILLEEVLGYNVAKVVTGSELQKLLSVAGCSMATTGISCAYPSFYHIALEVMEFHTTLSEWSTALEQLGDLAPNDLGTLGYEGYEGMFIFEQPRKKCLEETGLDLSYFFSFNASWFHPENYLATIGSVDMDRLLPCSQRLYVEWPDLGDQYLSATGDSEGVEFVASARLKCWEGKWWLAPACRSNASRCVAVVTGPEAWGMPYMVQQAAFHNMPLAIASALDTPTYEEINRELQSVFYWWSPDPTFAAFETRAVVFPPHNAAEHRQGIYQTQPSTEPVLKLVSSGLESSARRAYRLLENMQIKDSDVSDLLRLHVESGSNPRLTACEWLQASRDQWITWIPSKTECLVSKGLVNEAGDFVTSTTNAADCATCPPGRASVKFERTFLCSNCTVGSYQNAWGSTTCFSCEPGTVAAEFGMTQCSLC
ncbi:unnamed protein product, partial [Symbiodinium necroappetens]